MTCITCGSELEQNQSAIFAIEVEGRLQFGWTCCHHPVGDVALLLASHTCVELWLRDHPEYVDEVHELVNSAHMNHE